MALQFSGPISMSQIKAELKTSSNSLRVYAYMVNLFAPDSLSEFYGIGAPTITSFTPISAGTGATVTITGTNFSGATAVSFGGTAATSFTVVSATSITAVVGVGTSGNVSVITAGGTAVKSGFTYIPYTPPPLNWESFELNVTDCETEVYTEYYSLDYPLVIGSYLYNGPTTSSPAAANTYYGASGIYVVGNAGIITTVSSCPPPISDPPPDTPVYLFYCSPKVGCVLSSVGTLTGSECDAICAGGDIE